MNEQALESPHVTAAWAALREASGSPIGARVRPAQALALARSLVASPARPPRRRRLVIGAGALVELQPGTGRGAPTLAPAPELLPELRAAQAGVRVYRVQVGGRVGERIVPDGAVVLVGRRQAEAGDLLLVAGFAGLRLSPAAAGGRPDSLAEVRVLGVVEGIIKGSSRRAP